MAIFYDEYQQTALNKSTVMRTYGVDPENDATTALRIRVYPTIPCEDGYSPTHYVKEGQAYRAVPSDVSDAEKELLYRIRAAKMSLEAVAENLKLPQTTDIAI